MVWLVAVKGGVKFFGGAVGPAVGYAFSDERVDASGRAVGYYSQADEGVEHLVVTADGAIERDVLDRVGYEAWVEGRDPATGVLRGRPRCSQGRALRFVEVTVNGPKSWTIAAELHPDIAHAYESAQDNAVDALARLYARKATTRVGAGGARQERLAGVEVVAVRHRTSRAGDPHRHVHVQLNARVLRADGQWRGLDSGAFRSMIGEINGLGHLVVAADPGFRATLAGHGYTLGVDGEIVELARAVPVLSKRHAQIEANVARFEQRWRAEHPGREPSRQLRRVWDRDAWLQGRPTKTPETAPGRLSAGWLAELAAAGIDPEGRRPARSVAGVRSGRVDRDRVAEQAVGRVGAGRSTWNEHDLAGAVCVELAEAGVIADLAVVGELVEDCTSRALAACVTVGDQDRTVASHVRHLTSPAVLGCWVDLQERLAVRCEPGTPASRALIAEAVARLDASNGASGGERGGGPVVLDDGQVRAVAAVAGTGRLVNVEGAAGSGKTTMLAVATAVIEAQGGRVLLVAPSAKAAKVAEGETGAPAGTLAKLVFEHGHRWDHAGRFTRLGHGDHCPITGTPYQGPDRAWQLDRTVTVIVDEAGMVDQDTARALLTVVDEAGARLVNVGDRAQLPAVGRGGYLDAAIAWSQPVEMAQLHRFRRRDPQEGWVRDDAYAELTRQIRAGTNPDTVFDALVARGQVRVHASAEAALEAIADDWMTTHARGESASVVVATNAEAAQLAGVIRHRLVAAGHVDDRHTVVGRDGNPVGAGDRIVTRRNDAHLGVLNREEWTVQTLHPDGSLVVRGGLRHHTTRLPATYVAEDVQLAYATTDYGAQGVTADHATVLISDTTTAAGLYVGMTRGRHTNTAHLIADSVDDARRQWVDAQDRDRADRGLAHEIAIARQSIAQAPTPPEQPELPFEPSTSSPLDHARADLTAATVALDQARQALNEARTEVAAEAGRLGTAARLLNTVDHHTAALDRLDTQVEVDGDRLADARCRLDALDTATGPRVAYREALDHARTNSDHEHVDDLTRFRAMSRHQREHTRSGFRAETIAAQRALTHTTEQVQMHRRDLAAAQDQLAEMALPDWLHDPAQRRPGAIQASLHAERIAPHEHATQAAHERHDHAAIAQRVVARGETHLLLIPHGRHQPTEVIAASEWDQLGSAQRQLLLATHHTAEITVDDIAALGTRAVEQACERALDVPHVDHRALLAVPDPMIEATRDRGIDRF